MRARARKSAGGTGDLKVAKILDQAIVWLTLAALFLVPLTFSFFGITASWGELRIVILHLFAGLVISLWGWRIALRLINSQGSPQISKPRDLISWVGKNPARWAIVAVGVLIVVQLVSTLLSPLPALSFYGVDEDRTGYNLYDSLSLYVIFFSVALRFRTFHELRLIVVTLISSGTIAAAYGLAQHFGWDPIGFSAGRLRPAASFDNTLNFGAYLVMVIPATLALAHHRVSKAMDWRPLALAIALAVQLAAIWISGGRGPYAGATVALIVLFAISIAMFDLKITVRAFGVFLAAAILGGVIVTLPSPQENTGIERLSSIGEQLLGGASTTSTEIKGGLEGRYQIWGSMLRLAGSWQTPEEESTIRRVLRPVFGLGPDMLVYSYPLVSKPQTSLTSVDNAHNYPLHILAERGFAGFLVLISASVLLVVAGIKTVWSLKNRRSEVLSWHWVVLALLPAAMGKLVELQTGVGRISDLTMTFAVLAGVLVVYELIVEPEKATPTETPGRRVNARSGLTMLSGLVAAIAISVVFLTLFVGWDMRRLSASFTLIDTYDDPNSEVKAQGWADAQAAAPERKTFTRVLADAYLEEAINVESRGEKQHAIALAEDGRNLLLEYEKLDPFEWDVQMLLAEITSKLVEWGENQYAQEMAVRYRRTTELYPSYPSIVGTAATAVESVGLHELAIEFADLAIGMEATTQPWSKAWYAKGRALFQLGRVDESISTLLIGAEKEPGEEGSLLCHRTLSQIYLLQGDTERSEFHRLLGNGDPP